MDLRCDWHFILKQNILYQDHQRPRWHDQALRHVLSAAYTDGDYLCSRCMLAYPALEHATKAFAERTPDCTIAS